MIHKILRLFGNTLTVNDKHFLLNRDNLTQTIQIILSQKRKTFFEFFLAFLKSILNFKFLERIQRKQFRCNYLKKKNLFLNFFLHFRIFIKFQTFAKKDDPRS